MYDHLTLFIYLASFIANVGALLVLISVVSTIFAFILTLFITFESDLKLTLAFNLFSKIKYSFYIAIFCAVIATLVPDHKTMMLMAASEAVHTTTGEKLTDQFINKIYEILKADKS